jgi:hypothetical protein
MQPDRARRVINLDYELFDEVSADDPVKVMPETRGHSPQRNRQSDRLRESFQTRHRPRRFLNHRPG